MSSIIPGEQQIDFPGYREFLTTSKLKCLFGFRATDLKTRKTRARINVREPEAQASGVHELKSVSPLSTEEPPVSPVKLNVRPDRKTSNICQDLQYPVQRQLSKSSLHKTTAEQIVIRSLTTFRACHAVLNIPELVDCILSQLEPRLGDSTTPASNEKRVRSCAGPLFNCLLVNLPFYNAAKRLISRRVSIDSIDCLQKYIHAGASRDNVCRDLLIHRVKTCEQSQFRLISQTRLRSLELYVCPKLIPSEDMLSHGTLRKIALPGCALVDDRLISSIAQRCPLLQILDLRACELVSDEGISKVAQYCPKLSYLNVGRVNGSSAITDKSIIDICTNTSIETLGLAGCAISDESVFAIARSRGMYIERLSMNQCHQISDRSICELLRSCPRLQVLEIVGCERTRDAKTLCYFKFSTGALVETSEVFALEMQLHEREVKHELERLKQRVLKSPRRVTN